MRITYIIAGSGRMECDVCLRDGLLARTMIALGHEVMFVPMYTPLPASVSSVGDDRLFYGGINVYLQQKFPFFRRAPRFVTRIFDHPRLIDFVSRFGHLTQAKDLAELTISVMEGEDGNQRKELAVLLEWLAEQPPPDAIILPTSLLAGLAAPLRRRLGAPVLCLLSGEDQFIDQFPEPHRAHALATLRRCARAIAGFLAPSRYYADFMTEYLALEPGTVQRMITGIDVAAYQSDATAAPAAAVAAAAGGELFTIGYRSQICPSNGLHVLAEAFKILKANPETAACRVRAAGHLAPGDRSYLAQIERQVREWGLAESFTYVGELTPKARIDFLRPLDVFTVPAIYPEPTGLYVPEALAASVPVVLPEVGCLPEWVNETGGGLLIAPSDPEVLAAAIARLMKDPPLARRLGQTGQAKIFAQYTLDHMARSILQAISTMTQSK